MDWYYKKLLPILISELDIIYNENDFVEITRNNVYCKIPKEIQELEVFCPTLKRNTETGYIEVFYSMQCLNIETSMSVFMVDDIYQSEIFTPNQNDYYKVFKYCNLPVKIVNNTCGNNDSILIIGHSHIIPFISILTRYFHTVIVIDNHLMNFTFDFMFPYVDFKHILILGSYETDKNNLVNVTRFD